MQEIVITVQGPHSENSCTREVRFAHGERGGCIEIRTWRERGKYEVVWNVNRGRGWRAKAWKASGLTREKAEALVIEKWTLLTDWLRNLEPEVRGNGAASAFSAQVATMIRKTRDGRSA